MPVEIPHFEFPFNIAGGKVVEREQDSLDDVANCVRAILLTPEEFRTDIDDFGLADMTFQKQPLPAQGILGDIRIQEPRVSLLIDIRPSIIDELIAEVTLELSPGGGT
jgi:hypothetical protein